MKKRSTEILQRLIKNPGEVLHVEKLIGDYSVSEKTMRKDIQEIVQFVSERNMKDAISFDNHTLKLNNKRFARRLMEQIYSMNPYDYKMSLEERKIYIIVTLLTQDGYYSMQQLADELYVTRNTIVNDCKIVGEYLQRYEIPFVARSKKGIQIRGDKKQIDLMLIDLFHGILPDLNSEKSFFVQYIMRKLGFFYNLADIMYHMNTFTKEHNIIFANDVFYEMACCIFVLVNQIQLEEDGGDRRTEEKEEDDLPLDLIGHIVNYVAEGIGYSSITRKELHYIESVIMQKGLSPQTESINDFELYGIICHFLLELSNEIGIDILSDDLLIGSLLSHIKSMDNWNDEDFNFEDSSFEAFYQMRHYAEDKFPILEQYLPYAMSDKMKDSIVIHICAALLRNRKNRMQFNVLISCPGSMATGKYLEAQVKNYFNFHIVDTVPAKKLEQMADTLENVDFVISTVAIARCPFPVIVVSPLMTVEDINRIQSAAFRTEQEKENPKKNRYGFISKIQRIYETGSSDSIAFLNHELEKVLANAFFAQAGKENDSLLLEMLKLKYIKIEDKEMDWHAAMKLASEDLVRDGYFDVSYVEEAIGNIEEYGNYIIIAKSIALAHARKEAGVYEDGISLLISREGIKFEDDEVVHLLFFFSQKGDTDYLNLFKEIIRLGQDADNIRSLIQCGTCTEAYSQIAHILAGGPGDVF